MLEPPGERAAHEFRSKLREATAEQHRRLDDRIGAIDLSTVRGRTAFQRIHEIANGRVLAACGGQAAEATGYLTRSTGEASGTTAGTTASEDHLHPDAVAYVMLGSQLGLAFIRKALPDAHRTGVLQSEPDIASWRGFLARIAANPPQGDLHDRILTDSTRVFDIFLAAADQTLSAHEFQTE
ncbi:heme oxygenase-like domain-containing protein [Albibacillus kandeliae]|uniref:hypothetical protein n=1 Tax=Albibacillus kandeliae TaxID=2174228 RepID=UPI000D69283B|nr:hypothetical protein [Albibacillus kandeliae]